MVKYQQQNQQRAEHGQPEYNTRNLTYSQKQALKDFDAYELKNLEIENRKLTVINDDLLKVKFSLVSISRCEIKLLS